MIRPPKDGIRTAALLSGIDLYSPQFTAFVSGVNHVLTLNGHDPIKI